MPLIENVRLPTEPVQSVLTLEPGLIRVAKSEHDVANYASTFARRPGTAPTNQPLPDTQVTSLEEELRATGHPSEEVVQGQTCLLWARWVGAHKTDRQVPALTFEPVRTAADATSLWTKICVVKTVYIRGMLSAQAGESQEAKEILSSLLPWLDANRSLVVSTPQLLYWAQQLLGRVALGQEVSVTHSTTIDGHESASFRLQAFRHWAVLATKNQEVSASTYGNGPGHLSKLEIWRAYYRFMSSILQNRHGIADHVSIEHSDLAIELRRVETSYENELLRNVQFPKATESNAVIEAWVEEFIRNWQILCGPNWSESDLGEGGRNSCGRNVLDMLYRAATKSFHSTLILRRLFQVHKALTDFGLAYKALDTYIELMDRARAGASKSEAPATSRDSDEVFMRTIAEGIEGLCSFGRYVEAEKAHELCDKLQDLLDELVLPHTASIPNGFASKSNGEVNGEKPVPPRLSADLLEATYRAIGIGKAQWARWTPFSEERINLQTAAIECLQKAAAQDLPPEKQLPTLYALSQLLAQTRDIDKAIATVKTALSSEAEKLGTDNTYSIQRQLLPFWHLLSLLLTSRQNFETAGQSCVAAFEQFSPPETIFGDFPNGSAGGGRLARGYRNAGLVDDMECDELQKIVEIRITELALTELTEGPEHAVNNSNDLLALYSRLFGRHGVIAVSEETSRKRSIQPPKSSGGTVRSLPGKLFHRRRVGRSSESSKGVLVNNAPSITEEPRPNTQATQTTQAPTIQVTNEEGKSSPHKHKRFHIHEHGKEGKRHSSAPLPSMGPSSQRSRSLSRGRKEPSHNASSTRQSFETSQETVPSSEVTADTAQPEQRSQLETIQSADVPEVPVSPDHDASEGAKQPLKEIPHNLASHEKVPPPAQHHDQPPQQDVRLPVVGPGTLRTDPIPRFPRTASQRHALSILVKIWLIIATLYRRGNMFDDSREACDEAAKVALKIESMVASVESSARAFSDGGWGGGGKSSDELWADVYCERADLLMAVARAREEKEGTVPSEGIREAVENYEQCLMYFADHPGGIVGLSNVLLDYYERKVELARRIDNGKPRAEEAPPSPPQDEPARPKHKREWSRISTGPTTNGWLEMDGPAANASAPVGASSSIPSTREEDLKKTPENLNRLAARDRAYGLLSTLTKLGSGWDNSEAWFALARAHELGGEVDKAKEILWWCVELEDTRPIRHWANVGCGGYVL
ncbi:hypothetical protein AYL99_03431 [Fonsecaea erecta]|uniref:Filamentation protein n=1 Tax=Fonsecaea erecta TaxID=1367422 RepID=A0A178ZN41_9EURO|nr:hypothetical protein AYL99_03431 [Fonsecaea erecta]OAP61230.1 hypothetical protein AYL99_03431 [Fonsecaea erecta]